MTRREFLHWSAFPEFQQGYDDYLDCCLRQLSGVAAQAYDRGANMAREDLDIIRERDRTR
jgi:hypothetical protein